MQLTKEKTDKLNVIKILKHLLFKTKIKIKDQKKRARHTKGKKVLQNKYLITDLYPECIQNSYYSIRKLTNHPPKQATDVNTYEWQISTQEDSHHH